MLGLGYYHAREQVFAGASSRIRQLAAFATLQEAYARHWVEGSVAPILQALEEAGPDRLSAYDSYRQRLEDAIMSVMPAERGMLGIQVYLGNDPEARHGIRFIRGESPSYFFPDDDVVRRVFLAVAQGEGSWRMRVTESGEAKILTARYYAPVFKRSMLGLRSLFGVLEVDVTLSWLANRIRAVSTAPETLIFFMDSEGSWTLPGVSSAPAGGGPADDASGLAALHRLMSAKQAGQALVGWQNKPHVAVYMPLRSGDLMLGMLIPEETLFGNLNRMTALFAAAGLILFLFALLSLRRTSNLILRPVRALGRNAERLSAGDFSPEGQGVAQRPASGRFSLLECAARWPDEPARLKNAATRLRAALRERQRDLTLLAATRERLFGEIALAGKLQHTLRRETEDPPEHFLLATTLHPAGHIARDVLDYFTEDGDALYCITASVTAHGIPAALLMDRVVPLLHELLLSGASPAEALQNANVIIHSYAPIDKTDLSPFVSVFIGMLSAQDGTLTWASAGKNPPYRVFAGKAAALPWSGDLPMGVKKDAAYRNQTMSLRPGETLFLCGARLIAMPSPAGGEFGEERLLSLLRASTGTPARLLEMIHAACLEHTGGTAPPDDIALLAVRWRGGRGA